MLDVDQISVLFSVALVWTVVATTCLLAARRDRRAPADDIGVMWLVVLGLYATLPPLSWVLQGGSYSVLSFYRLFTLQPSIGEIVHLLHIALAYTCGFAVVYLVLARHVPRGLATTHVHISSSKMTGALVIVVVYQVAMLIVGAGGFIRTPESYMDSYLVIQELPLAARQALKVGGGVVSVAMLVFLIAILQRWPRQRKLFILYLAMVLLSFDPKGARSTVATGLLSAGIAWHVLVRPIRARWWIAAGTIGLMLFTAFGLLRTLESWTEFGSLSTEGSGVGEFEVLWANAVQLLQARESGWIDIPAAARFGEFWAFVPSQLLPFEKLSLADWFLETFYPEDKAMGVGWAFGAIGQAVIGGGVAEAALRGAILGALAACVMKWHRSSTTHWWSLPLYLYLVVFMFQSVRDTTFQLIGTAVQIVIPALLLIAVSGELLAMGGNAGRPAGVACRRFST